MPGRPRSIPAASRYAPRSDLSGKAARFPGLDGMRAVAALLVVCFHSALWLTYIAPGSIAAAPSALRSLFLTGWIGVDVFFVLSGFLIGRMLLTQAADGGVAFTAFYVRRTFRIFPAYYVTLSAAVFLFSRLASFRPLFGAPADTVVHSSWANYAYVSNYLYGVYGPNAMSWGWSLCVEEHFYLVLPALVALLFRLARGSGRWLALLGLGLAPVAVRMLVYVRDPAHTVPLLAVYPQSHTHCDGLLLGALIAYADVFHGEWLSRVVARFRMPCWLVAIGCFASVFVWGGWLLPGLFRVVPQYLLLAIGSACVLVNVLRPGDPAARVLGHRVWYPVARISYGIYLVHLFAVFAVLPWWPRGPYSTAAATAALLGFTAAVAVLSALAAALLFLLVERPLLDRGVVLSRRFARDTTVPDVVAEAASRVTGR